MQHEMEGRTEVEVKDCEQWRKICVKHSHLNAIGQWCSAAVPTLLH